MRRSVRPQRPRWPVWWRRWTSSTLKSTTCPKLTELTPATLWVTPIPSPGHTAHFHCSHSAGCLTPCHFVKSGNQAADEEGVHPRVLQRQEVHVGLLHTQQISFFHGQDVCQGIMTETCEGLVDFHTGPSSTKLLTFYSSVLLHRGPQRELLRDALMSELETAKFPSTKVSKKRSCLWSVSTAQVVTP